jgi:hypothetical protein
LIVVAFQALDIPHVVTPRLQGLAGDGFGRVVAGEASQLAKCFRWFVTVAGRTPRACSSISHHGHQPLMVTHGDRVGDAAILPPTWQG